MTDSTTIEVVLSPQQLRDLANGAKSTDATQRRSRTSRIVVGIAAVVALVVAGGLAHLAAKQKQVPPAVLSPARRLPPPEPPPAEVPAPAVEPMLFANPFDHYEVFEFPAGTTQAEARDAVAKALMDRAHDRGPGVLKLHIKSKKHTSQPKRAGE